MSEATPPDIAEELAFAGDLIQRVLNHATGRSSAQCIGELPRDVYFIGSLRPEPVGDTDSDRWLQELAEKLAPAAAGIEALLTVGSGVVRVIQAELSWNVYYRLQPSLEEQQRFQNPLLRDTTDSEQEERSEVPSSDGAEGNGRPDQAVTARERPMPKFARVCCKAKGDVELKFDGRSVDVTLTALQAAVDAELSRAAEVQESDPFALRVGQRRQPEKPNKIEPSAMADEGAYRQYWQLLPEVVRTPWAIRIEQKGRAADEPGTAVVSIDVINATPIAQKDEVHEPFLFDVGLRLDFEEGALRPFVLKSAPRDFREDPRMYGRGRNCAVDRLGDDTLAMTHTPRYEQGRYVTRESPTAEVKALADDPFPTLDAIADAMAKYLGSWDAALKEYQQQSAWGIPEEEAFLQDRERYVQELERFKAGLGLLRTNVDVAYAFKLTNKAFDRNQLAKWRLMQIIFLVSQLPGLTSRDPGSVERQTVDIVYFPTGGGKTEAYLGAVVFSCFWDRLSGKAAGVTAWARFPLRLLTAQQLQRFANIIGSAELVRRSEPDDRLSGSNVDGFAVGYYVGAGGTPNEILAPGTPGGSSKLPWVQAQDAGIRKGLKRIAKCPACRTQSIEVTLDEERISLRHRCTNQDCAFTNGILPIFIVDNDIYRYLPSVMVGTIDKLAQIGIARKFSIILGAVDGKCPKHGYYNGKCCQDGCAEKLPTRNVPAGLTGPSLFVQDELHLLREGLGTFDGHYETLFQQLLKELGTGAPVKILASSATIEQFERQVEHIYGSSNARIFPGPGPKKGESFYASTKPYPQRIFVGVLPHNKTLLNALLELAEYYLAELGTSRATDQGVAERYAASATYFIANRELDAFKADLRDDVSAALARDEILEPNVYTLTGSTSADEVSETLEVLERESQSQDPPQMVLATNTISHGVDIDRLNWMFFFGMPRQTAEYIQASSRVGRKHVGVVFTCFSPARERDQSHYHYFSKQHEFLGKLVEPVPVNRWSKFSLDRTLPGAVNAMFLHEEGAKLPPARRNSMYRLDTVKTLLNSDAIRFADLEKLILEAYRVADIEGPQPAFRARLKRQLETIVFDQILTNVRQVNFVSEAMAPSPMRSLREVDEQVGIRLDAAGEAWGRLRVRDRRNDNNGDDSW